jgi:curved DNA-binding protein CbpA
MAKSHYELLGVSPQASAEAIKRAFRQEISRYHPDKVQHLGKEFQELAQGRAAELTRAYRTLMDEAAREAYDEELRQGTGAPPPVPEARSSPEPEAGEPPGPAEPEPAGAATHNRTSDLLVRRASLMRFREALQRGFDGLESASVRGFDVASTLKPKRGMFRKAEPDLRLLARFVPFVDTPAINETWSFALRATPKLEAPICAFLMGVGLAPKKDLAHTVEENRRRARGRAAGLAIVLLDVRDWEALIPTGAPQAARTILERLRSP